MGRILFLSVAAFLALRYIQISNKKHAKLPAPEENKALPAADGPPKLGPASAAERVSPEQRQTGS